jgi:hypothetical protein
MTLSTWQDWVAWAGIVIPLLSLAWAAAFYVWNRRRELDHQEYHKIFEIMDHLGQSGGSIASKMAAAYELRKYIAYKDVILRLCDQVNIDGNAAKMLSNELKRTAEYLKAK